MYNAIYRTMNVTPSEQRSTRPLTEQQRHDPAERNLNRRRRSLHAPNAISLSKQPAPDGSGGFRKPLVVNLHRQCKLTHPNRRGKAATRAASPHVAQSKHTPDRYTETGWVITVYVVLGNAAIISVIKLYFETVCIESCLFD